MSSAINKRVCVIGSGPCGLASIKQCCDEGLEVVCFEQFEKFGGLWRYKDNGPSVAKTTIINTSKEFSAFSDFPPPEQFPNFMHNSKMYKYFEMYAEKFALEQFIRYRTQVVDVSFNDDHEVTGRWKVVLKEENGHEYSEVFDGVMVCTGHHLTPLMPTFPGQEKFKGTISHTHSYKTSAGYEGKSVVVVGIGNSAVDAAVELAPLAKSVYLSTRRGAWLCGRVGRGGQPWDRFNATHVYHWLTTSLPGSLVNTVLEGLANLNVVDHELYGLKPSHRITQQHPTINDSLPNCILSGRVSVRKNIREFTENGVIFEGSEREVQVDTVLLATGYLLQTPFLDSSIVGHVSNEVKLYKNMFRADLPHAHTLAFIGLAQPLGPVQTLGEMQARWFAALMAGHVQLPSKAEMVKVIETDKNYRDEHFYSAARHALEISYIDYMLYVAEQLGVRPNLMKYALLDPKLAYKLVTGLFSTYQFRLEGRLKWDGAREAVMNLDNRIAAALKTVD